MKLEDEAVKNIFDWVCAIGDEGQVEKNIREAIEPLSATIKHLHTENERYRRALKEILLLKEEYTMDEYPEQVDYVVEKALEPSHD